MSNQINNDIFAEEFSKSLMEDDQRSEISKRFPKQYMQKLILSLDIPDVYQYNQPELMDLLRSRMKGLF